MLWSFVLGKIYFTCCESLNMRYLAAYLLAVLGGNENPSENDIKRILSSVGIEADGALLKRVVKELSGKDIEELIAEGKLHSYQYKSTM